MRAGKLEKKERSNSKDIIKKARGKIRRRKRWTPGYNRAHQNGRHKDLKKRGGNNVPHPKYVVKTFSPFFSTCESKHRTFVHFLREDNDPMTNPKFQFWYAAKKGLSIFTICNRNYWIGPMCFLNITWLDDVNWVIGFISSICNGSSVRRCYFIVTMASLYWSMPEICTTTIGKLGETKTWDI